MRTTIDAAGRLVIPRELRVAVGLGPGSVVEVTADGAAVRVEAVATEGVVERNGRLVIPAGGAPVDDALVEELRRAGQR